MKIGIFDSGIGGLTALHALARKLPGAQYLYVGDTARVPYGNKGAGTVTRYAKEMIGFLVEHNVNAVAVACNTASALAFPYLRESFKIPLYEVIHPAVEEAVKTTRTNRIGVIGTRSTIASGAYERAVHRHGKRFVLQGVACPLFVPLVEEGMEKHPAAKLIAENYLAPLRRAKIDTLILGCTHYPLLHTLIARVMGKGVALISSADAVAAEVARLYRGEVPKPARSSHADIQLYATDEPERLHEFAERILRRSLPPAQLVPL